MTPTLQSRWLLRCVVDAVCSGMEGSVSQSNMGQSKSKSESWVFVSINMNRLARRVTGCKVFEMNEMSVSVVLTGMSLWYC